MTTQPDFEEFLRLLEKYKVEYMIVGGYAVAFHGSPRFTKDMDVFYRDSEQNVENLRSALVEFGFAAEELPEPRFFQKGSIINFGIEPVRIDLLNQIDGVEFCEAWERKVRGRYGDVSTIFIGCDDLKRNKAATNRTQDKADLEKLE